MENINQKYFLLINSLANHSHILDIFIVVLGEFMPYLFIAIEVYLYFFASRQKESVLAFEAMLIGLGINQIIGLFYFHNRPFMDHLGVLLHKHLSDNSFPSDHTTFMLSIAFSLLFYAKSRVVGAYLLIFGIIGGFARVYEGVHYPFDIVGGIITGLVGAIIIYTIKGYLEPLNNAVIKMIKGLKK